MGIWQVQTTLNRGELDPRVAGRIDLEQYYQGVATGTNVLCIPQGGVTKRPGSEYIVSIEEAARLESFAFSVDQVYLLSFTEGVASIWRDDTLKDTVFVPFTGSDIQEFDFIQSADTIIITHPDHPPEKIVRHGDTDWEAESAIATGDIPFFDFNDPSSPATATEIQRLTFTNVTDGDRFKLSFGGFLTDEIVYDTNDAGFSTASDMAKELNDLPNILRDTVTIVATSSLIFDITFQGQSSKEWELIKATPIYVNNATNWSATGLSTKSGTTRQEAVWSELRGFPATCTFHEGRLFFGGSRSLPNTIWGSYVADYFKFVPDKGLDDEPIQATLDTDQINVIEAIYSNRSLQIFTAGAEFYVPETPITPENLSVQRQTNLGSKRVRPVTIDGITLFLQRTGKALYQFLFVDEQQANTSSSISILAPHLIIDPIKMAVKRGSATNDANYVYLLNSDGTITVFNTLTSEGVAGFTRWTTRSGDLIKSITTLDNILYLTVERQIDGETVYYIEKENEDFNLDCAKSVTGSGLTTVSVPHLESETVKVKADGAVRDDQVVSGEEITIDPAADTVEVGLDFNPIIKTMPLNNHGLKGGPNIAQKKKILRAAIHIYESNGIIVNGQRIADRTIGVDQFDPPEPQTGIRRIFLPGWSIEAQLTITQDTPFPFTILNIANEVKT